MDREARINHIRSLAQAAQNRGEPYGWFEELYSSSEGDADAIPWADGEPNPNLMAWAEREGLSGQDLGGQDTGGKGRALVIGCGLGDDAQELARRGFEVTAFDVSASAIEWCQRLYGGEGVRYEAQDLFHLPAAYLAAFDFILEIYTLQAIPIGTRAPGFGAIAACLAPGGRLLVIARGRDDDEPTPDVPWPLSRAELACFEEAGLKPVSFEDYVDMEDPPKRRFRACYERPAGE